MAPLAWSTTPAHVRALALGVGGGLAALVWHRPDVLLLVSPLLMVAAWGVLERPRTSPTVQLRLSTGVLHEGEGGVVRVTVSPADGLRHLCAVVSPSPFVVPEGRGGVTSVEVPRGARDCVAAARFRSTRWGRRPLGSLVVVGTTRWGAYRWGPDKSRLPDITSLPVPVPFDARAQPPHPSGLVGVNRSARVGDGTEFAGIRPFQPGDRLRRVHWPVSLRARQLHVTTTYADHDSHVLLLVDATTELGSSGGVDGPASSLDLTVRAAAALSEHHLRRGDRVGLRLLGGGGVSRVPTGSGRRHLRRVLTDLAALHHGMPDHDPHLLRLGATAGTFVVLLSPLASAAALVPAVTLARRGLPVVVVDTLPDTAAGLFSDPFLALAWRIRVLEREAELHRVGESGVPVVRWRGPRSLDQVLRDLGRQAAAPRMARR